MQNFQNDLFFSFRFCSPLFSAPAGKKKTLPRLFPPSRTPPGNIRPKTSWLMKAPPPRPTIPYMEASAILIPKLIRNAREQSNICLMTKNA